MPRSKKRSKSPCVASRFFFVHLASRLNFIARNDAKSKTAFELRTTSKRFNFFVPRRADS